MKLILVDSSSAILLYKTELFERLLEQYRVGFTESVFFELTLYDYPSAEVFKNLGETEKLSIFTNNLDRNVTNQPFPDVSSLNIGERDTILQHIQGIGDFILIDDGKGARLCFQHQLPFISALLFPKILYLVGELSKRECDQKTEALINVGRYSQKIIDKATGLTSNELEQYLP